MIRDLFELKFLKGKRTQITAIIIAGLTLALNLGKIDSTTYTAIVGFLTSVGLLTAAAHKPK